MRHALRPLLAGVALLALLPWSACATPVAAAPPTPWPSLTPTLSSTPAPTPTPVQQAPADLASAELVALRALAVVSAGEPEVEALQRAAAQKADRAGAGASDYGERARLAALLPKLTAEYRHEDQSNRVVGLQTSGEVDYLRLSPSEMFLVRASWDLPSLVAAQGEVAAGAQAQARARSRAEAVDRVTVLFFERRRQRLELLLAPPPEPLARAQLELEIARLGAEVDALTGGRLSGRAP